MRRVLVALVGLALVPLTACESATEPAARVADAGPAWERLPDPPLSRRAAGVVAAVDGVVVVVGGDQGPPCPPTASCIIGRADRTRDGAAYDPSTGRWSRIADAPGPITDHAPHAVVGTTLHVIGEDGDLLSYDAQADRWTERDLPGTTGWYDLAADGDRLLAYPGSNESEGRDLPDLVLDDGRWQRVPANPLGPLFGRQLVAAGDDLVLLGKRLLTADGIDDPAVIRAAVLRDGHWRELPPSRQLGGAGFVWTGDLLVDPTLGGADGGEVNGFGEVLPFGGTLDPSIGTWGRLRDAPGARTRGWPVSTAGASATGHVARDGWLRSGLTGGWQRITRPSGAPDQPGLATWLGDDLVVVGGQSLPAGDEIGAVDGWTEDLYATSAWVLRDPDR